MKILEVYLPETHDDGLGDIYLTKLDKIVLLTGKNGSGKSRILNKIKNSLKSFGAINRNNQTYINTQKKIKELNQGKIDLQQAIFDQPEKKEDFSKQLEIIEQSIKSQFEIIENLQRIVVDKNSIKSDSIIDFVPKSLNLSDPSRMDKSSLISASNNADRIGLQNIANAAFAKIQYIQNRYYASSHPEMQIDQNTIDQAKYEYKRLQEIIELFLGTKIGRTVDEEATIFGLTLNNSKLSDGQKILLQFCIALYSQEKELNEYILFLDEPENHLHPSAIIETINHLLQYTNNCQIWIATHSIPILSYFGPDNIHFIDEGSISYSGKKPEKILKGLLGDDLSIQKMRDFMNLSYEFAIKKYSFESLLLPQSIMKTGADPQVNTFYEYLRKSTQDSYRIIDYGAGKGRILENLFDLNSIDRDKFALKIDYIAFDKFDHDKSICVNNIEKIYGSIESRYYNDISDLMNSWGKETFNVILLCNVFHEIDPKYWLETFNNQSYIFDLLEDNGYLVIIEDHQIPKGELAHNNGFTVLDTEQIKILFDIKSNDAKFEFSISKENNRIKAHYIPKEYLSRISEETRFSALKSLNRQAKSKLREIRQLEKNYSNGIIHGFWLEQYANSSLCLSEISNVTHIRTPSVNR